MSSFLLNGPLELTRGRGARGLVKPSSLSRLWTHDKRGVLGSWEDTSISGYPCRDPQKSAKPMRQTFCGERARDYWPLLP